MNKDRKSPLPCRYRIRNPDKSSPWQFFCTVAKQLIDGETLPRIPSQQKLRGRYLSCAHCICYKKEVPK